MKRLISLTFIVLALYSCTSSRKFLERGDYDQAVRKSVQKLHKNHSNFNEADILDDAFKKAQERDLDRITFLKKEGNPESWDQIVRLYTNIKARQDVVKTLPKIKDISGKLLVFNFINCDDDIINAKQNAAAYFYETGVRLLTSKNRQDARKAYTQFQNVKGYYSNFKDVDAKLAQAQELGITKVLFKVNNLTQQIIPASVEQEITRVTTRDLNKQWIRFYTSAAQGVYYDYSVLVNLRTIDISPERVMESKYSDTKKVADGYEYALDIKGNVKKDEKGNDIKIAKYKEISCTILESKQKKSARIIGDLQYYDNKTRDLLKSEPLMAETIFDHHAAVPMGNISALSEESKEKIKCSPVPFPSNTEMVIQASETLKNMVKNIVWNNMGVID